MTGTGGGWGDGGQGGGDCMGDSMDGQFCDGLKIGFWGALLNGMDGDRYDTLAIE